MPANKGICLLSPPWKSEAEVIISCRLVKQSVNTVFFQTLKKVQSDIILLLFPTNPRSMWKPTTKSSSRQILKADKSSTSVPLSSGVQKRGIFHYNDLFSDTPSNTKHQISFNAPLKILTWQMHKTIIIKVFKLVTLDFVCLQRCSFFSFISYICWWNFTVSDFRFLVWRLCDIGAFLGSDVFCCSSRRADFLRGLEWVTFTQMDINYSHTFRMVTLWHLQPKLIFRLQKWAEVCVSVYMCHNLAFFRYQVGTTTSWAAAGVSVSAFTHTLITTLAHRLIGLISSLEGCRGSQRLPR